MSGKRNGEIIDQIIKHFKLIRSWIREDDRVEVTFKHGLREKPHYETGDMEFEDNRTRTIIVEINGGARKTTGLVEDFFEELETMYEGKYDADQGD